MVRIATRHSLAGTFYGVGSLFLAACAGNVDGSPPDEAADTNAHSLGRTTEQDGAGCDTVSAGDGWVNTFMPQSTATFSVELRNYPSSPATPPLIDTVVGLSNGPADSFQDLGPIVRFNDNGNIDARDGNAYVGEFPYRTSDGSFDFKMEVSIPEHRYTVWVRHGDSPFKPFELLGANLAFRNEQSGVTRLDTVARFTDSAVGGLKTCGFEYDAPDSCRTSIAGAWTSRNFPAQSGLMRIEFTATASASTIDAVVGLAKGAPASFGALAAIVRFRPDGTFDARNGATYASDATVAYVAGRAYEFALDVDPTNHSYSASVRDTSIHDNPSIVLAHDYAFRSEQSSVTSLDRLGQFVDGTPGSLDVCELTVAY